MPVHDLFVVFVVSLELLLTPLQNACHDVKLNAMVMSKLVLLTSDQYVFLVASIEPNPSPLRAEQHKLVLQDVLGHTQARRHTTPWSNLFIHANTVSYCTLGHASTTSYYACTVPLCHAHTCVLCATCF